MNNIENNVFKQYQELGVALQNHNIIVKLRNEMIEDNQTSSQGISPVHYYVIDAPSGTGKSLLSFSMHESGALKVVHLVLNAGELNAQAIYQSLEPLSIFFRQALAIDKNVMVQEVENLSCAKLMQSLTKYALVAFIMKVLAIKNNGKVMTVNELRLAINAMRSKKKSQNIPVFFIDEAVKLKDELGNMSDADSKTLRYFRNISLCWYICGSDGYEFVHGQFCSQDECIK